MPALFNSYRHGNILAFALMNNSREQVSMIQTDKTLDIQGISGPRAVIVIQSTLAGMNPGQILTVVTTCRTLRRNVEELCRAQGWNLIGMKEGEGITLNLQIRK